MCRDVHRQDNVLGLAMDDGTVDNVGLVDTQESGDFLPLRTGRTEQVRTWE